jgi:DNA mismatch repair protein MutS2
MDKYLQDIVRDKRYWESKRQQIRQQEKKLEDVIARYEKDLETVNLQRKEIVKAAKTEAQQILSEANAKIENTIREIKESQAEKERTKTARQELEQFKTGIYDTKDDDDDAIARQMEKLNERRNRKKQRSKKTDVPPTNQKQTPTFETGDTVRIQGQTATGTIIEINGKQATVALGMIKSTVKLDKLEKVSRSRLKKESKNSTFVSTRTADAIYQKKLNFKHEIDVRGMRGDEALQAVTYFIDDAILANISPVRILHGTGAGILRQLIRDYLSTTPGVKSYKDEHVQLGGVGITVVELE